METQENTKNTNSNESNWETKDALVHKALELIGLVGWPAFSLMALAKEKQCPISDVYSTFKDKPDVVRCFLESVDAQVLSQISPDHLEEPRRERLFDILMNRFECLGLHKQALRTIWEGALLDPFSLLQAMPKALHSLQWMLEAAGYEVQGISGFIKLNGFALLYMGVVSDWLNDDTVDQAGTMARLDKLIGKAENYLS